MINKYFSTDELISRVGSLPTVNDELELFKKDWINALNRYVRVDPDFTNLLDPGTYGRRLVLERYVPMGIFDSHYCGQLRTVEIVFAGPGDSLPWLTVTVNYAIDGFQTGTFTIDNQTAMKSCKKLNELREFGRIGRFLASGELKTSFAESLDEFLEAVPVILLLPVNIIVLMFGVFVAIARKLADRDKVGTRFVATRKPSILPPEDRGAPNGYWYVVLDNQAERREELMAAVLARISERSEFGASTYNKEIVQWGGHALKEVRQQTVVEFRRGVIYIGIYRYGRDLYVRWDSHVNRRIWCFQKFSYSDCLGYRFPRGYFSWSRPFFEDVPSVFEFAPFFSRMTDYDWADFDALEGFIHEIVIGEVKAFRDRHQIKKEIDFELKKWSGQSESKPGEQSEVKRGIANWASGFARRQ